jgi:hypothetical protein
MSSRGEARRFPLHDCSLYRGPHVRSRASFCRAAPNPSVAIRNFCVAVWGQWVMGRSVGIYCSLPAFEFPPPPSLWGRSGQRAAHLVVAQLVCRSTAWPCFVGIPNNSLWLRRIKGRSMCCLLT